MHYGMLKELILTRKRNRTQDDGKLNCEATVRAWEILSRRFDAFLFQQEVAVAENVLGKLVT